MKTRLTSRLLALLLVLCMTLSVAVMVSAESVGSVTLGMSVSRSGSNVAVVISAASFTGTGATDIEFNINYDSSKLTYVGETDGSTNLSFAGYCYDRGTFVRCSGSGKAMSAGGTLVTLNFTVKDGAAGAAQFSMDSAMAISNVDDVDVTPAGAKSIEVADYKVTVGSVTNGTVTTSPTGVVAPGTTVTVTATPNAGYMLDAISVTKADGSAVTVSGNTFTMPSSNVTVTATFKEAVYNVTVSQPANGTLSVNPTSGKMGTEVTVTATANNGYNVDSVTVTDASGKSVTVTKSGDKYTFKIPASNVTVSAKIVGKNYAITKGSVTGGKLDVASSAAYGSTVTVTATPNTGWKLVDVTITSGGQVVTATKNGNQYTFTMPNGEVKVSATFQECVYTITSGTASNGTYTVSASSAKYGTKININASPASGYQVASVTVKDASGNKIKVSGSGTAYSFNMPDSNVTVSVSFQKIPANTYKVTVESGEGYEISPDKNSAAAGATVTLTVTANDGYTVTGVTVTSNGKNITVSGSGETYTFKMPAAGVTVSAECEKLSYSVSIEQPENATITVDPENAAYGDTVTLTITPDEGYTVDSVKILDGEGNEVGYTMSGEQYTFVMPASEVSVSVGMKEMPTEPTEEPTEKPTEPVGDPTEETKPSAPVVQDGGDSNNMIIMLLCIALLVVIVAIVIILLARRKKAEPAGGETSAAEDLDE